ncbi:MAG: hypothetical protein HND58_11460 [Planctomycetota bacterium]|nr:MAG: hypothetical protein HND58_11460 [Planctomycetota bacterium]
MRGVLGAAVVTPVGGDGGRGLVEVVVDLLASRGETLAVVESCTGGLLGSMITAVAGSSAVFTGGWVTYTNAMKVSAVGVDRGLFPEVVAGAPGAVSRGGGGVDGRGAGWSVRGTRSAASGGPIMRWRSRGLRGRTGGARPSRWGRCGSAGRAADGSVDCRRFVFAGGRGAVREWSSNTALGMLRLKLAGVDMELLRELERVSG